MAPTSNPCLATGEDVHSKKTPQQLAPLEKRELPTIPPPPEYPPPERDSTRDLEEGRESGPPPESHLGRESHPPHDSRHSSVIRRRAEIVVPPLPVVRGVSPSAPSSQRERAALTEEVAPPRKKDPRSE